MGTPQQGRQWYQWASLAVSHLTPLIIYFAIHSSVASDTEALALAWFAPVAWTLFSSLRLRQLDLFGLLGVVVYGITLAIAIFFHTGPLPLKLHHAVAVGAVGLVCLGSVARGTPLFFLVIQRSLKRTRYAGQVEIALSNPRVVKRISTATLLVGIAALADAVLQTALALMLSTSAFLTATTAIHLGVLVGIVLGVLLWVKSTR